MADENQKAPGGAGQGGGQDLACTAPDSCSSQSPELMTELVAAMARHPKVTLGAGVVGGLLLGEWWRKRRKTGC